MGAIWMPRIGFITSLSELVGYKAGVALDREQMRTFLESKAPDLFAGPDGALLRIRAEEYDQHLVTLLYSVGNIKSPSLMPSLIQIFHRVKGDGRLFKIYQEVGEQFPKFIHKAMNETLGKGEKAIDPTPFCEWARAQHGIDGALMALEMLEGLNEDLHKSSFAKIRSVEWKDVAELAELFDSEKLGTLHGEFFDQRFVDFLSHNFHSIDKVNWRKFEGLTCEFFHRAGLEVEIGKGRNDESIDARIWKKGKRGKKPPLILVQCKRQKDKVEKVVVKALYADVVHEKAELGLVVTSSALSPGARKVCSARSYPVVESNRDTLKKWIGAMRTPYSGIFLGE